MVNATAKNKNLTCKTGSNVEKENIKGRTEMIKGNRCFILTKIKNKHNKLIYLARIEYLNLSISELRPRSTKKKPTRDENSKGPLIGPSLFYTSKLYTTEVSISY